MPITLLLLLVLPLQQVFLFVCMSVKVFERALEFVGHNPLIWVGYFEWLKDFGSLPPHLVRAKMDEALKQVSPQFCFPITEFKYLDFVSPMDRVLRCFTFEPSHCAP